MSIRAAEVECLTFMSTNLRPVGQALYLPVHKERGMLCGQIIRDYQIQTPRTDRKFLIKECDLSL